MACPTVFSRRLTLLVVVVLFQISAGASDAVVRGEPTAPEQPFHRAAPRFEAAARIVLPDESIAVSLTPSVMICDGMPEQRQRLDLALRRFREAGLMLPNLEIVFDPSTTSCNGYRGLFQTSFSPWRISICSEAGFVYEHELAHAWETAVLSDELREEFMALRGYSVWSDHDVAWNRRGVEDAVVIIQQGLGGLPLPPDLFDEQRSRLAAFELLTGSPDPRLAEWEAARNAIDLIERETTATLDGHQSPTLQPPRSG